MILSIIYMSKIKEPSTEQVFMMDTSMKIGHVSLNVSNLQSSLDFYQKILGFKVVGKPSSERALLSAGGDSSSSYLVELLQAKVNSDHDSKRAGLYHFAILLPERKYLADMLQNLRKNTGLVYFDGLADHLVSEAIYIRDPDFNGIEIYRDRPISEWSWSGNRIEMATLRLNTSDLLRESTEKGWKEMPPKTKIGHVHLHVRNIPKAIKFYHDILGLNLTATIPSAAFFAAGKYHHHIAANTWLGTDISPASSESLGLNHFSMVLSNKEQFQRLADQLSSSGNTLTALSESGFIYDMDGIKMQIQHS
jgi:catechol 2,3-dioxygenase